MILKQTRIKTDWMAWRRLKLENEPNITGRCNTMLMSLVTPKWSSQKIDVKLLALENSLTGLEQLTGETIFAFMRTVVVSCNAPE